MTRRSSALAGVIVVPEGFDATTPVGGLPPILRHALALAAAGATEIRLVGGDADSPADYRLRVPVLRGAPNAVPAIVVRADTTCHRLLPKRLARDLAVDAIAVAGEPAAWIAVAGAARTAAVIAAAAEGTRPENAITVDLEPGEFVLPASTPMQRAQAMRPHLRSLIKPTGGVIDRHVMRPVSLVMTRALARTSLTPNTVSIVSLLLALGAAALVALPHPAFGVAGAVLHVFMRIVDCVDGELARLRYQQSRIGEWLDTVGDAIGIAALVAAVGWRAAEDASDARWLVMGIVGVVAWMVVQSFQYIALVRAGGRGSIQYVEWGHRRTGDRTLAERLASAVDVLLRIDVISVAYAALIVARLLPALLIIHGTAAIIAAAYFAGQLWTKPPGVNPDRAL